MNGRIGIKFHLPISKLIIIILSIIIIVYYIIFITFLDYPTTGASLFPFIVILSVLTAFFAVFNSLNIIRNTSTSLVISLFGFPSSGKTTFLTVLFRNLEMKDIENISFRPSGVETTERIHSDYSTLCKQKWLHHTTFKEVFFYRYQAIKKAPFFSRKYKIEIPDFAGRHLSETKEKKYGWLHHDTFFDEVVKSDAILFAIDTSELKNKTKQQVKKMVENFIVAMNIIFQEKGVSPDKKMKAPVALLFMKADLVISPEQYEKKSEKEKTTKLLTEQFKDLIKWCNKNCSTFNIFLTSSVGYLENGNPPEELKPFGVIQPIIWILRHF